MNRVSKNVFLVLFFITGMGLFFANNSIPLLDPAEPVCAEIAREMAESQDYLIPRLYGVYLLDTCPLYFWFAAGAFHIFGVSEFAARFVSAVMAVLTVMMVYISATLLWNERVGFWSGMILCSSLLIFYAGKTSGTETTRLFFITGALLCFLLELYWPVYIFCGLGILVWGLSGLLLPFAVIIPYCVLTGHTSVLKRIHLLPGLLLAGILCSPWFILMYEAYGMEFLRYAFWVDNVFGAGIRLVFPMAGCRYYIPVLLAGIFPWTGLLLKSVKDGICESKTVDLQRNLFLLLWWILPLLYFCFRDTGQIYVTLVSFPAIAVLISWNIERMVREDKNNFKSWAFLSILSYLTASVFWVAGGQKMPELEFGAIVLGSVTLMLGIGVAVSLLVYKDGMLAAWLHAATGILTMIIAYTFLLPVAAPYFSVKDAAVHFDNITADVHRKVYIENFLRPGFMFYAQMPGVGLDFGKPGDIQTLLGDRESKYMVIRRSTFDTMGNQGNAASWHLLEERKGICIFEEK